MAKKLTVEVDAETTKAKRKIQELAENGGSSAGADASPAIDKAARALSGAAEKTSRSFGKLDEASQGMNRQMISVTRAFAGMATGLAMSYASRYFAEGSTGRIAMDYGGAIISGASSGAMAGMALGPQGAAVGAVVGGTVGAAKTYLDKEGEMKAHLDEFEKSEQTYRRLAAWQEKLRELSESLDRDELVRILKILKSSEGADRGAIISSIKDGRYGEAAEAQRKAEPGSSKLRHLYAAPTKRPRRRQTSRSPQKCAPRSTPSTRSRASAATSPEATQGSVISRESTKSRSRSSRRSRRRPGKDRVRSNGKLHTTNDRSCAAR